MDKIISTYKMYREGKYDVCRMLFVDLMERYSSLSLSIHSKRVIDSKKLIENTWNCIYGNNRLVCEALSNLTVTDNLVCKELLDKFKHCFELNKSIPSFPNQLKLNLAYNFIYWYWLKFAYLPTDDCRYMVLNVVIEPLIWILNDYEDDYINHELNSYTEPEEFIHILLRLANCVLKVPPIESFQIIDIIHISLLLLIESSTEKTLPDQYKQLSESFLENAHQIEYHMKQQSGNQKCDIQVSSKMGYFKFGFKQINSQLDLRFYKNAICSFFITVTLLYVKDKIYEDAQKTLEIALIFGCDKEFSFLYKYLTAIVKYYLEKFVESSCIISQLYNMVTNDYSKSRIMILSGLVNSKLSKNHCAIDNFNDVLTRMNTCKNVALYYIACENKALNLHTSYIIFLQQMTENIKSEMVQCESPILVDYESKCMLLLHPQPEITLSEALYISANSNLRADHYRIASAWYNELIRLLEENLDMNVRGSVIQFPDVKFLFHEAILANLKSHDYEIAINLAQTVIGNYVPHSSDNIIVNPCGIASRKRKVQLSPRHWNYCLYHFEDDVIALLLLSDVYQKQSDFQKQMETLNRCYNAILSYLDYRNSPVQKKIKTKNNMDEEKEVIEQSDMFCKMIMSKILLRKANLSIKLKINEDIDCTFSKALSFNCDDEDVVYYYKKWLLSVNRVDDAMNLKPGIKESKFDFEEHKDYSVQYLLQGSIEDCGQRVNQVPIAEFEDNISDDDDDLLAELYED